MSEVAAQTPAAVLVSGGIDSAVLVADMCGQRRLVFPVFVRGGLAWEPAELVHLRTFLQAIARPILQPLVLLDQPDGDVYGEHWSITGRDVPHAATPDNAVFLPGRNLFLISKTAVWCALNGVHVLALGSLGSNPFSDSTPEFDCELARLVERAMGEPFEIIRPLASLTKPDVIRRGAALPLELTFSCIQPVAGVHCGRCNKCEERRRGFREAGVVDRTTYAQPPE